MAAPILSRPIKGRSNQLHIDWSMFKLEVVLTHRDDEGKEFVIAYASRSNNAVESRYSSYEGECLAALWAVTHFKCYLFDTQFTLVIDHQPLKWLMESVKLKGELALWALILQDMMDHLTSCSSQGVDGQFSDLEVEDGATNQRDIHDDDLVLEFLQTCMVPGTMGAKKQDRVL
ncbi:hypothetical protein AXG93_59s1130 [Marchantia polymorpha subsp. ruderalis]|uniref:Reverse transcriptase RNase H-like domain-containing protein n=1 Tax=Marchantia polymorpha subsp. ruderalis TaxID=1480154 RepID=A0A176W2I3_MARPO|nr:hypothetical protein AXG93_59s1130 [Marchantia polymorpha subsp. ruderalis]